MSGDGHKATKRILPAGHYIVAKRHRAERDTCRGCNDGVPPLAACVAYSTIMFVISYGIKTIRFSFEKTGCYVTLGKKDGTAVTLAFGRERDGWRYNAANWYPDDDGKSSAGVAAWTANGVLTLLLCCVESPFRIQLKCRNLEDGTLEIAAAKNFCFFGAPQWPKLIGHRI